MKQPIFFKILLALFFLISFASCSQIKYDLTYKLKRVDIKENHKRVQKTLHSDHKIALEKSHEGYQSTRIINSVEKNSHEQTLEKPELQILASASEIDYLSHESLLHFENSEIASTKKDKPLRLREDYKEKLRHVENIGEFKIVRKEIKKSLADNYRKSSGSADTFAIIGLASSLLGLIVAAFIFGGIAVITSTIALSTGTDKVGVAVIGLIIGMFDFIIGILLVTGVIAI